MRRQPRHTRHHPALAALALAAGLCAASPAAAAERPSFDCAKATTATEKAICSNSRLARLDRALNTAYRALFTHLDGETEWLKDEQKEFLTQRDACGTDVPCIARRSEERRSALALERKPADDPRAAFVGFYRNAQGWILVRRRPDGGHVLTGSAAEPTSARWVCDVEGDVVSVAKGVATVEAGEKNDSHPLTLRLRGNHLIVAEDEARRLAGYSCGANGYLEGRYRRVPLS